MSEQHLIYRAGDWTSIANDLPSVDPFTAHLKAKAFDATNRRGAGSVFGETVTAAQGLDISKAARRRGIEEQEGAEK